MLGRYKLKTGNKALTINQLAYIDFNIAVSSHVEFHLLSPSAQIAGVFPARDRIENRRILTLSLQTNSVAAIKRQSNILKCQAHQYQARRRWRSVCARGSITKRTSGMDFQLLETHHTAF